MNLNVINQSKSRLPRTFLKLWIQFLSQALKRKGFPESLDGKTLTLVFLEKKEAQSINAQFRDRPYATDVLSFDPIEPTSVGELILCPAVLKAQAKEHGLSFQLELGYMVLHGVLHLLGYDHEDSDERASEMFELQDEIFDAISIRYVNRSRTSSRKKKNRRS